MSLSRTQIAGLAYLAYAADRAAEREQNHREMVDRYEGHIERWSAAIDRLENARRRIITNLEQNIERLTRATDRYGRLLSESSKNWLDRHIKIAQHHFDPNLRSESDLKVEDFYKRCLSTQEQISRLKDWIDEGKESVRSINDKISSLEDKIRSAKDKIR